MERNNNLNNESLETLVEIYNTFKNNSFLTDRYMGKKVDKGEVADLYESEASFLLNKETLIKRIEDIYETILWYLRIV